MAGLTELAKNASERDLSGLSAPDNKSELYKYSKISSWFTQAVQRNASQNTSEKYGTPLRLNESLPLETIDLVKKLSDDLITQALASEVVPSVTIQDGVYEIIHTPDSPKSIQVIVTGNATLIERFSDDELMRACHVHVRQGAHLEHVRIHHSKAPVFSQCMAKVDGSYSNIQFAIGTQRYRGHLLIELTTKGAHADSFGLHLVSEQQHADTQSFIHHRIEETTSNQLYKTLVQGEAVSAFTGRILVDKDAQRIDAAQLNRNLLLGEKARVFGRPQLEIFADDVKCAHGHTTGQIDQEALFYLQSRGIPHAKAFQLLSQGHVNDIISRAPQVVQDDLRSLATQG